MTVETRIIIEGDQMTVNRSQDCTANLEYAKRMHNEGRHGSSEMRHAAHLPEIVIEQYMNTHNVSYRDIFVNPEHIKRMLNDPDLRDLRIWKGRV